MDKLTPIREAALGQGIPRDEVERWIRTARPCATLGAEGDGPLAGYFGGNPLLPMGAPNPNTPLVASVDLAVIPPEATDLPLTPDGHLLLFADTEGWGKYGGVVYVPPGTPVAERTRPDATVYPRRPLHLSIDLELPNRADATAEHPHAEELSDVWWNDGEAVMSEGPLRLGGYGWHWNDNPCEDDQVVLAQWSSDDAYVKFLDLGIATWVIGRDDLAARRFDRVEVVVDMVG